jgi:hypothetical protein
MNKLLVVFVVASAVSGCATVTHDSTQPIKIEARLADGSSVNGADCKLSNDYGSIECKSGDTVQVHRSSQDLNIVCKTGGQPDAVGRAISRANAGMFGNIILGGAIGAIVDHSRGTAYTYPTWIQLSYGKSLVFDRSNEKDGQPVAGNELGNTSSMMATSDIGTPPPGEGHVPMPLATASGSTEAHTGGTSSTPSAQPNAARSHAAQVKFGKFSYVAEKLAKADGCGSDQGAALTTEPGPVESYRVECNDGRAFAVHCEYGVCNAVR